VPEPADLLDDVTLQDVVRSAQTGDHRALERLWIDSKPWLISLLLRHKPAEADLDDLLHEVACTLIARIRDVDDPRAFRGWIKMVGLNVARLSARKRATLKAHLPAMQQHAQVTTHDPARAAPADQSIISQDDAARAMAAARELPPEFAEPLLLRCVQGLSYRQIATIMSLPETTIETRIARARRMLRDKLVAAGTPSGGGTSPQAPLAGAAWRGQNQPLAATAIMPPS
jgi:RNA polymerase sigma-70 factor, ECF subfamily